MKYNPLVSIVIPVYKGEPYLKEAIDSCLSQTYKNIEIIVVNDGSPDNGMTERIALSYGDRIRYFAKENGGVSSALNYGISQMRGEWFSWLSHDDVYDKRKIQKQIEILQDIPNKDCVVRCESSLIDAKGKYIFRPHCLISGKFTGIQMMKMHYLHEVSLYGCSLLIHQNVLKRTGLFDEGLRALQDEMYWWKIMSQDVPFISIRDKLVYIRVHKNQQTRNLADIFNVERQRMQEEIQKKYESNLLTDDKYATLFVFKRVRSGEIDQVQKLIDAILVRTKRKFRFKLTIAYYQLFGCVYKLIKDLYRWCLKQ